MHSMPFRRPELLDVATQAQTMAGRTKQQPMAVAFQWVAMISMAAMGVTAVSNLVRKAFIRNIMAAAGVKANFRDTEFYHLIDVEEERVNKQTNQPERHLLSLTRGNTITREFVRLT